MIDCSRDAVMTVDKLKNFITILAKFGYDSVQLYTEDTYEIDGEPYFGYMRGRYTKEEIRTLGKFCRKLGVELIRVYKLWRTSIKCSVGIHMPISTT